jgi:hypothetical protein
MMTFLPFADFKKSAKFLDYKRLGKQRIEAFQILKVLINESKGYANHPAINMWRGYSEMLKLYFNVIVKEWIKRGYVNNYELFSVDESKLVDPWWLGNEDFHRAMRSRLIEKFPEFYLPLFPDDKGFNDSKYWWPVNETRTFRKI